MVVGEVVAIPKFGVISEPVWFNFLLMDFVAGKLAESIGALIVPTAAARRCKMAERILMM